MHWVAAAVVTEVAPATGGGFLRVPKGRREEAGYRCDHGHVSDPCANCGSRDTATTLSNVDLILEQIVRCRACGIETTGEI
jgi:hypothetical protein